MITFTLWILTILALLLASIILCIYAAVKLGMVLLAFLVPWLGFCLFMAVGAFFDKH